MQLMSINIELDRHLDSVKNCIVQENPDVVCFQEALQQQVSEFEKAFGMQSIFSSMRGEYDGLGVCIFSKYDIQKKNEYYYHTIENEDGRIYPCDRVVLVGEVRVGEDVYTIATTHFTWSRNGETDAWQEKDLKKLLDFLRMQYPEVILCGDFNIVRGKPAYRELVKQYVDAIPEKYDSSLDVNLHRVGHLKRMVDYIFTTPAYRAKNVHLVGGVSDHMAVVGNIEKFSE